MTARDVRSNGLDPADHVSPPPTATVPVARSAVAGVRPFWITFDTAGRRVGLRRVGPGEAVVIGSAESADVTLRDRFVSARHCRVTHMGTRALVEDLGSTNGVFVGGATILRAEIPIGGVFTLGRTVLLVSAEGDGAAPDEPPLAHLVGTSAVMRRLAVVVRRVARVALPALVRGESGSGKELVARALHDESPRAKGPFVALNAAAISRELAESELFGHERGAFTGALRTVRGAFREADKGTLFLDEIGALPSELQPKLLRVVEEGKVRPVGSEQSHRIDVRLVTATCEPLESRVLAGKFRADLYERLAACVVHVPPLRDHLEDLPALADALLAGAGLGERRPTPAALAMLCEHGFPGNVRELRNVLVQAALEAGGTIEAEHVTLVLADRTGRARRHIEPREALRIYEEVGGNLSAAARVTEIPRTTLRAIVRAGKMGA